MSRVFLMISRCAPMRCRMALRGHCAEQRCGASRVDCPDWPRSKAEAGCPPRIKHRQDTCQPGPVTPHSPHLTPPCPPRPPRTTTPQNTMAVTRPIYPLVYGALTATNPSPFGGAGRQIKRLVRERLLDRHARSTPLHCGLAYLERLPSRRSSSAPVPSI